MASPRQPILEGRPVCCRVAPMGQRWEHAVARLLHTETGRWFYRCTTCDTFGAYEDDLLANRRRIEGWSPPEVAQPRAPAVDRHFVMTRPVSVRPARRQSGRRKEGGEGWGSRDGLGVEWEGTTSEEERPAHPSPAPLWQTSGFFPKPGEPRQPSLNGRLVPCKLAPPIERWGHWTVRLTQKSTGRPLYRCNT